jgi:hypothetical protein
MRETRISLPMLALVGATRGMLGVGIGLMIARKLGRKQRFTVGSALAAVGALATIPLAIKVFRGARTDQAAAKADQSAKAAQPAMPNSRPRVPTGEAMPH